jgi:hypothetical protein
MARRASKLIFAAVMLGSATLPAWAQNYDYLSRSDAISLSAGDANAVNTVVQTPTPWPWYLDKVNITGSGPRSVIFMRKYLSEPAGQPGDASATNSTPPNQ